ncbi:hypothetical protein ACUUL3_08640 [Thiovibrio sp. JS02]
MRKTAKTTMLLDVPFLPDPAYVRFLNARRHTLYSVHFSLFLPEIPDGRHRPREGAGFPELAAALKELKGPKKYALLNSRFHHPRLYGDREMLRTLLMSLERLLADGNLDGITIVDFYLLQALSDLAPEVAAQLEAVPGVNCMLDALDRIVSCCDAIDRSHFKLPTKLNLDRSLNRRPDALKEMASQCRRHYPGIRLTLLANEGCLCHCPFKFSHDAQIAFANLGLAANETFAANRDLGCIRVLSESPEQLFKSPFIRPEDQSQYEGVVDVLKLCGRTLGPAFLMRAVEAYANGCYDGNLLDLLDTLEWLAPKLFIDNAGLPADFFRRLTNCDRQCARCDYCKQLLSRHSRKLPPSLPDFRQR